MSARTTALCALIATRRQGAWSDGILKEYVQRDRLERRDAALAATLTYGVMQNRMLLDHYLEQVVSGGLSRLQPVSARIRFCCWIRFRTLRRSTKPSSRRSGT